jgi:hypothetical protein
VKSLSYSAQIYDWTSSTSDLRNFETFG